MEVFDGLRAGLLKDRSQFYKDLAIQFYGANRAGAKVSQGTLDQFWLWSMQAGLKNAYESIKAFSETDFTEDLKKIDVPALVLHGEDDQIVPIKDSAKKSAAYKGREGNLLSRSAARNNGYPSGSGQLSPSGISPVLKRDPVEPQVSRGKFTSLTMEWSSGKEHSFDCGRTTEGERI